MTWDLADYGAGNDRTRVSHHFVVTLVAFKRARGLELRNALVVGSASSSPSSASVPELYAFVKEWIRCAASAGKKLIRLRVR